MAVRDCKASGEASVQHWDRSAALAAVSSLGIEGPNLRVAQYWLSLWSNGRPPKRSAFNPERLRDVLQGIAVFDVRPGESVRCRLAGPAYKFRFGFEISGRDWLALTVPDQRQLRLERNSLTVGGAMSAGRRRDPDRNGPSQWFSDVQLPFSDIAEDGARSYLHHSNWRPVGAEFLLDRPRLAKPTTADDFNAISIC